MKKSKWIDRYLYDVVRRLPESQRKDIEEELATLIEDMLEEREGNGRSEEENIREVLAELGTPAALAAKYRGGEQHLLGGEYYPLYCQVLKIVLICVAAGMAAASVISGFVQISVTSVEGLIQYIQTDFMNLAAIPGALLQAFGMTTLVFWILERNQVKLQGKVSWTVESLPEVPVKKAVISRGESVTGLVFGVLVSVMFICVPELIGAWLKVPNGELAVVPIFNMAVWNRTLPLLLLSVGAGMLEDIVRLFVGRYTLIVMWVSIAANSVVAALTILVCGRADTWNRDFWNQISSVLGEDAGVKLQFSGSEWLTDGRFIHVFVMIVILACLLEVGQTVYRTLRYGIRREAD